MECVQQSPGLVRRHEQLLKKSEKYNLLSDVFLSVALKDPLACQHVLRVLTGKKDLIVKEVRSQYYVAKVVSHDAKLDILAEDASGEIYSIEIQRKETIDHPRRIRFYAAMIDSEYLMKGKTYAELPKVCVFYISETDLWKAGRTVYNVKKALSDLNGEYNDNLEIEYINTAVNDGSEIAQLMQYFRTADPEDMSQGDLSRYVHFLKSEEGGQKIMCEVSDEIYALGKEDGIAEGEARGRAEEKKAVSMELHQLGIDESMIALAVKASVTQVHRWLTMA